jgi:hypothetical protein
MKDTWSHASMHGQIILPPGFLDVVFAWATQTKEVIKSSLS